MRVVASPLMRAAAEVAAPRLRSLSITRGVLAGGVAAFLFRTLFFGGGSRDLSLAWLGTAIVLAATAAIAAALLGAFPWPELDPVGLAFLVLAGLFVLWNGASVSWSLDPDRSWAYTNRGLVYLAFACLGLFVGVLVPRAPRAVAGGFAVLLAGVLGWALLAKVVPSLFPDGGRLAGLRAAIVVVAATSLLRADAETPLEPRQRSEFVRYALIGVGVLAALIFAGSTIKAGGPGAWLHARAHEFTSQASVSEKPGRVKSFSSNHRWAWWKESWDSFVEHPTEGTGAGSLVLVPRPRPSTSLDAT